MWSGLGNQLFQYAAGRAVAERTGTRLRLDASYFGIEPNRRFELDNFRIRAKVVRGPAKSAEFMADHTAEDAWIREHYGAEPLREPHYHYSGVLEQAGPEAFLIGYWQSERNFAPVAGRLRRELRFKRLGRAARALRREIEATPDSVALHVRRGDYAEDPDTNRKFGTCPPEYYADAAAVIREQRRDPTFFVFSDDPGWCAENLELPGRSRVISGCTAAYEDLALIAACEDAITANSSFSWWGAWLGESEHSIVVSPRSWFQAAPRDTADLRPERWLLI